MVWLRELKIKDDFQVAILVFIGISELIGNYIFLSFEF